MPESLVFAKAGSFPPGGVFFYQDPENGVPLLQDKTNLESLLSKVAQAYTAAGKPAPEPLRAHVEDYICRHVPRGFCLGRYPENHPIFLTPHVLKDRCQELARKTPRRADPGTVLSRMNICGPCPANSKSFCLSCTGLTDWALRLARRTKIGQDEAMGVCTHAKIMVSLLVSLDPIASEPGENCPETCWRNHGPIS